MLSIVYSITLLLVSLVFGFNGDFIPTAFVALAIEFFSNLGAFYLCGVTKDLRPVTSLRLEAYGVLILAALVSNTIFITLNWSPEVYLIYVVNFLVTVVGVIFGARFYISTWLKLKDLLSKPSPVSLPG